MGLKTHPQMESLITHEYVYLEPGISRCKTMANKLIYIYNDDAQNYTFCRLWLKVEMFGHSP